MVQQAQSSSTAPNRAWKAFLWTLLIVLTLAALLFGAGASQFSTGTSFQTSVSNAWRTHFPHTQLSALSNRLPAFYSVTQPKAAASVSSSLFPEIKHNVEAQAGAAPETADQGVSASLLKDAEQLVPASSKLFPEVKQNIQALSQADASGNVQQPADSGLTLSLLNCAKKLVPASDALFPEIKPNVQERSGSLTAQEHQTPPQQSSSWSLFRNAEQPPKATARPVDWVLENSLLRTAELESDVALLHNDNQQLSAHLLSAARQLAAIGQTVQLPQDGRAPAHTVQLNQNKAAAAAVLLVSLACISGVIWAMTRACSRCSSQAASQHNFAEQVSEDTQCVKCILENMLWTEYFCCVVIRRELQCILVLPQQCNCLITAESAKAVSSCEQPY